MNKRGVARLARKIGAYNMIPNMIWSLAGLLPVTIFCYRHLNVTWFCLMLSASAATLFLPRTFFLFPQSGINPSFYKKAGIGYIKKFTQNGELINGILRKKYPAHKIVTHSPLSLQKLYRQTFMFEKFHFLLVSLIHSTRSVRSFLRLGFCACTY